MIEVYTCLTAPQIFKVLIISKIFFSLPFSISFWNSSVADELIHHLDDYHTRWMINVQYGLLNLSGTDN
jgi:hypothetical protein